MDEFLELHNAPKVNHAESQHLNRSITSTESQYSKTDNKET